ncbi:MAG: CotH kinase family protein [Acidobacteriota bacterium]
MLKRLRRALCVVCCLTAGAVLLAGPPAPAPALTQADLFQPTKVWTAQLTFTPDQWKAMEPTRGRYSPGSRFGGGEWLQGAPGARNGWGAAQGVEFHYVHASLEFAGQTFRDVAVRYKGNGTYMDARGSGKLPFKIDLNKFVKGQKLAGIETLNFHNNITDRGWMNEVLAYRLYRDAGVPAPRSSYVRVYLTVTGQFASRYAGLYTIAENVDEHFLRARFGSGAGALLKPVSVNPFNDLGGDWSRYLQTYDPKSDLVKADQQRVIEFCQFVAHARDADFAARIGEYVDLDAFARYMAVLVWINNIDSLLDRGQNFYVHLSPSTRKFTFIPWDQDHSFGGFVSVQPGDYANGSIYKPWSDNIRFLARMFAVPAFRTAYIARMREFSGSLFKPARFAAQVAEVAAAIRPAVADERGRAAQFETIAAGRSGLLPFAAARANSVIAQLSKQ